MQSGKRLYIGRLARDATRRDVEDFFAKSGPLIDVRVMQGFGFVEFESPRVRCLSLSSRTPHLWQGVQMQRASWMERPTDACWLVRRVGMDGHGPARPATGRVFRAAGR